MKKARKLASKPGTKPSDPFILAEAEAVYHVRPTSKLKVGPNGMPSITSLLGIGKSLPQSFDSLSNRHQYISIIREGLTMDSLLQLLEVTGLSTSEIASIIHTSERTLRRYENDTILNPEQSERIIEIARLFSKGSEVFGTLDQFKTWMNSKIIALGNIMPKELLDTSLGIESLQEELGRIEYGIFA